MPPSTYSLLALTHEHITEFRQLNALFANAFEDTEHYASQPPTDDYVRQTLSNPNVIALMAQTGSECVGGLVAYVLPKLEQARSEVYIYDLAVDENHRRKGIATALIEALKPIAQSRGAWVMYVQADYADPPAIALYTKLGVREDVLHFDIPI
jgi:aminoglycoside 3-N-acetyltransferase I